MLFLTGISGVKAPVVPPSQGHNWNQYRGWTCRVFFAVSWKNRTRGEEVMLWNSWRMWRSKAEPLALSPLCTYMHMNVLITHWPNLPWIRRLCLWVSWNVLCSAPAVPVPIPPLTKTPSVYSFLLLRAVAWTQTWMIFHNLNKSASRRSCVFPDSYLIFKLLCMNCFNIQLLPNSLKGLFPLNINAQFKTYCRSQLKKSYLRLWLHSPKCHHTAT